MSDEIVQRKRSARGERIMRKREPQLIESTKKILVMKGAHTSEVIQEVLRDINRLSKPFSVAFSRKNSIIPFEDANPIEFLTTKNDCSLFALGSHSKKRPHNLVLGRTFDGHMLDMVEFGVDSFKSMTEIDCAKKNVGSKPLFLFLGNQWESDSLYARIQNLLLDMFRGVKLDMISLSGIDHVIVCMVEDSKIFLRVYSIAFTQSGSRVPNVTLTCSGPCMDLTVRRNQVATDDLWKVACKKPSAALTAKVKNIGRTSMGDKVGRIHMERQNLDKMKSRRATALRGERHSKSAEGSEDAQQSKKRRISSA